MSTDHIIKLDHGDNISRISSLRRDMSMTGVPLKDTHRGTLVLLDEHLSSIRKRPKGPCSLIQVMAGKGEA